MADDLMEHWKLSLSTRAKSTTGPLKVPGEQEIPISQSDDVAYIARADGGWLSGLFERLRLEQRHDLHLEPPTRYYTAISIAE
jgi:hypothetical protein